MATTTNAGLDIQFNRGLRQDLEADLLPPGALVVANNIEFDKSARLRRRDGYTPLGQTKYSKSAVYSGVARRTAIGSNGEHLLFTDNDVFFSTDNGMGSAGIDLFPSRVAASLIDKTVVGADQGAQIVFCDSAGPVTAYVQYNNAAGQYQTYCNVVDSATGAKILTAVPIGFGVLNFVQPRVIIIGGSVAIIVTASTTAGNLVAAQIDLSAPTITVTVTGFITDADAQPYFDICENFADTALGTPAFVICYQQFSGGVHKPVLRVMNLAYATIHGPFSWIEPVTAVGWNCSCMSVVGAPVAGTQNIYAAAWNSTNAFLETIMIRFDLNPAGHVRSRAANAALLAPASQIVIGRTAANEAFLAYSDYTSFNGGLGRQYDPRGHLWLNNVDVAGLIQTNTAFANYSVGSKFFVDSAGGIYGMARFNDPTGAQSHYLLLDYTAIGQSVYAGPPRFFAKPSPVLHVAANLVPLGNNGLATGVNGMSGTTGDRFVFTAVTNVGASVLSGQQVGIWTFQALGPRRFLSTSANRELMLGGATPLIYDGQRLIESSFYSYPCVGDDVFTLNRQYATATVGGAIVKGIYLYRFVFEWIDGNGKRHQSPASPAVSVDMSASATNTNQVTWTIPTLHATRKQQTPANPYAGAFPGDLQAPVRIIGYRTLVGQPTPFYRLGTKLAYGAAVIDPEIGINNTTTQTGVTLVDAQNDAQIATNEILYNVTVLPSTAPPSTDLMCTHGRRLWGIDRESPERIWCTKTFQEGEAPGYSPGLFITVPGCGTMHGIASQDGKLYALATNGVYLASYGDGPDNTGQGFFPEPTLITTTATCDDARGVITGSDGIYFTGPDHGGQGIYLIRRGDGTPLSIGLRVRDELSVCPQIRGVIDRPDKGRMEFLFVDNDLSPSQSKLLYYHYDLPDESGIGQWTVALYRDGVALESLGQWPDDGSLAYPGRTVSLSVVTTSVPGAESIAIQDGASTGQDSTTFSPIQIETGDLRPFGMMGYGEVQSLSLLATAYDADVDLIFEASYDGGVTWPDTFAWPLSSETPLDMYLRHWEPETKKLGYGCVRYRFSDTHPVDVFGTYGVYWHGISLELAPLGGNIRLPTEKMG